MSASAVWTASGAAYASWKCSHLWNPSTRQHYCGYQILGLSIDVRNPFGKNADEFRPEQWLCSKAQ
jgi:hypothetical protein